MHLVGHLAINADDVAATRAFYEETCGWHFEPWGPPGFHRAELPDGMTIVVQQRRELVPATRTVGAEPTVMVDDLAACVGRATAAGGRLLMEPTTIPGVGTVAFVADPDGNPVGFMQHDAAGPDRTAGEGSHGVR